MCCEKQVVIGRKKIVSGVKIANLTLKGKLATFFRAEKSEPDTFHERIESVLKISSKCRLV